MGTQGKKFKHLSYHDRLLIERLLKLKTPIARIAELVGRTDATIYAELKRGRYTYLDGSKWEYIDKYSPDKADERYKKNLKAKGAAIKLGNDYELADHIEHKIIDDGYSPDAVLGEIKAKGLQFKTSICRNTLYSYIRKGVFLRLNERYLMFYKKRKNHKAAKKPAKASRGTSIEKRPEIIDERSTFGHWEMDCVCGPSKASLLVLTERLTRKEIIFTMRDQTAASVVHELNRLEFRYGRKFKQIFKSITVDNGSEFSDCAGMERSIYGKNNKRTVFYYCHPYRASERGTNERINREIRRKIPKGTCLEKFTTEQIQAVEDWVNNYPRRIFGFRSSADLFREQLAMLDNSA